MCLISYCELFIGEEVEKVYIWCVGKMATFGVYRECEIAVKYVLRVTKVYQLNVYFYSNRKELGLLESRCNSIAHQRPVTIFPNHPVCLPAITARLSSGILYRVPRKLSTARNSDDCSLAPGILSFNACIGGRSGGRVAVLRSTSVRQWRPLAWNPTSLCR